MNDEMNNDAQSQPPRAARSASVRFREGGASSGDDRAGQLDAANRSLMDALRFSYFLLGIAMAILGVLYLASGFHTIAESERGVKLRFGRVVEAELMPGPQWALPFPFGEIVRVSAGVEIEDLTDEFWPALSEQQKQQDPSTIVGGQDLAPERDGFLITADSAIAHTKWTVRYSKGDDPRNFAQNVFLGDEEEMVRAAVSRGIIQAVATISIEELLQAGDNSRVDVQAREAAQQVLDGFNSGIRIDSLTMLEKIPPFYVRAAFENVQSAESTSNQIRQEANTRREEVLNVAAGEAASEFVRQIDLYEDAVELGDDVAAALVLADINRLFDGEPIEVDGQPMHYSVSGEVAQILNEAREYRTSVVIDRRAESIEFAAKYESFKTNPQVLVHSEWMRGISDFYNREEVYVTFVPPTTARLQLLLNQDPEYALAYEKFRKEMANIAAQEAREDRRKRQDRNVDTGRQIMGG